MRVQLAFWPRDLNAWHNGTQTLLQEDISNKFVRLIVKNQIYSTSVLANCSMRSSVTLRTERVRVELEAVTNFVF